VIAAAVVVLLGVAGWVVFSPSTADVVVIQSVDPDGTVRWVEGEFVKAESNNSMVQELPGPTRVSRLASDATFRTALGCGTNTAGLQLAPFTGLGEVECTREEFLSSEYSFYAPKLYFNGYGEIVEVAGRYHP
jgi:hypothetical protein